MNKINHKYILLIFTNWFIMVGLLIFSLLTYNLTICYDNWSTILSYISITILIYQIIIMRIMKIKIADFRFLFILFSFVFLFGQVWLIGFGREDAIFWGVIFRYSEGLLYNAGLFSICYIQGIFIGLLYRPKLSSGGHSFLSKLTTEKMSYYCYKTGFALLIISIPFRLYMDLFSLIYTRMQGGYQGIGTPVGPMKDIAILTVPGIIFMLVSKYKSKKRNFLIFYMSLFYLIVFMILTGDRRYYVTAIIAILFAYLKTYKPKLKLRTICLVSIIGILGLNMLTVLRQIRRYSLTTISGFLNIYFNELFSLNPINDTLSEFGITFMSVVFAFKLVPSTIPYQYGFSFYGAIPSLLPIGWLVGDFFKKVSILNTFNKIEGYPVGGSLPSELYANFGWFGIIGAILIGILLSKIFYINKEEHINTFLVARHYSTMYILINIVRASTMEMLRQGVIVYFMPTIIMYLLVKKTLSAYRKL